MFYDGRNDSLHLWFGIFSVQRTNLSSFFLKEETDLRIFFDLLLSVKSCIKPAQNRQFNFSPILTQSILITLNLVFFENRAKHQIGCKYPRQEKLFALLLGFFFWLNQAPES